MVQEMPEEGDANRLSAKKFRQRYARKGLPVVMRGTEDGPTFDEVGEMCPDGAMEAYEIHAEGKGWAGFSDAALHGPRLRHGRVREIRHGFGSHAGARNLRWRCRRF